MPHPKVTVISTCCDAGPFFSEAIESVLAQNFSDFELLLVDGEAHDGSTVLARSYAMRCPDRISYLEQSGHERGGMSAARNLGVANARGEYIAFIAADDRWRPDKLREQVAIMDAHREIGMVAGAVNHWRSWNGGEDLVRLTGHVVDAVAPAPEAALAIAPLGRAAPPCSSDVMIRRSVLEQVGCFEARVAGAFEDAACFGKLLLAAPVYFSSRIWADQRITDSGCMATARSDRRYAAMRAAFLGWFCDYLKSCDAPRRKAVLRAARRTRRRDFFIQAFDFQTAVGRLLVSVMERWRTSPLDR